MLPPGINFRYGWERNSLGTARTTASQTTTVVMLGLIRGSGSPSESRVWPHSVLWRLGGFFFLLLLEGAGCLASPGSPVGVNNNNPGVNIYMSVEEVKKLLGKEACCNPAVFKLCNQSTCVCFCVPLTSVNLALKLGRTPPNCYS